MAKKQTATWVVFVRGLALSLGVYLLAVVLLALLLVKGVLPENGGRTAVAAAALLASLSGSLIGARGTPWGRLPGAVLSAAAFAAVLITVGYLGWESGVVWTGEGSVILLCVLAGGVLAGVTGGKRGRRLKRKGARR